MKKIKVKPILGLRLLVAVLFLSASSAAFGQELILESLDNYLLCDTSMIRTKNDTTMVICNRKDRHTTFMLVNIGATNTPILYFDDVYVNDFELIGNRIYYCGYEMDGTIRKAVFGFFDYNTFSSTFPVLDYYVLDFCTEFKKLDLYQIVEYPTTETHLVMTGSTGTRPDALVEVKHVLGSTLSHCNVYVSNDETERLDDVAVTRKYVVVSSRREENGIPVVTFRSFHLPTMMGGGIFAASSVNTLLVSSPAADSPVLLDYPGTNIIDGYAAVYKIQGYSRFVMLRLNAAASYISSVEILGDDAQTVYPVDIQYNKKSSVYDILAQNIYARDERYFSHRMQIYHVTPQVYNNQVPYGEGSKYLTDGLFLKLWSIAPLQWSDYFVASGDFSQMPWLFRYNHNMWKYCPERFEYIFDVGEPKSISRECLIIYKRHYFEKKEKQIRDNEILFRTKCGHITEQED